MESMSEPQERNEVAANTNGYVVTHTDELNSGERLIKLIEGHEVGIFNIDGEYHAYPNWCPHQGAPLCEGPVNGTIETSFDKESLETDFSWGRDGEMLTCPWHGFEFDLTSGACRSDKKYSLREYPTRVEDGYVVVSLSYD
jgi:nitrite reductase/ring-hydroxylating ferredoxin subunit